MAAQNMSQESAMDEERRDVLAILAASVNKPRGSVSSTGSGSGSRSRSGGRSQSPYTTTSPRSPVRSMLDVSSPSLPRHASIAGTTTNGGVTLPPVRSMLDIDSPQPSPVVRSMLDVSSPPSGSAGAGSRSAQTSPTAANHTAQAHSTRQSRSSSDAGSRPTIEFGPRATTRIDPKEYQFSGYLTNNPGGPAVPKRNTQAGKRFPSSMAEIVRAGADLSGFGGGSRDRGRNSSITGTGISTSKSKSPHNRLTQRSSSPVPSTSSKYAVLDDGRVIDMNNAYRRLSDANLALSGGGLSSLSRRGRSNRSQSDDAGDSRGARLEKDYVPMDGDEGVEDSTDESDSEGQRGRKKATRSVDEDNRGPESQTLGMGRAKGPRTPLSLMAAAEAERQEIASKEALHERYKVKSLLDPEITITSPSGIKSSKPVVHPFTSFDQDTSGFATPHDSDTEADITDIKRAQNLSLTMEMIKSTPATSRCVRTIQRGDFAMVQREAHDNHRRTRKYLVATDLSSEAAHALEWTIGTVLRDGDTMLAIYCIDEELGINNGGDDAQIKQQISAVASAQQSARASRSNTPLLGPSMGPSPLGQNFRLDSSSRATSPMGRDSRSRAEQDRFRAVEDITDRVSELLRKTKLQVQVNIEVLHCKNPKHLICEVIDFVNPTLVILGSRGRSALKGVILGSFSNYLVTKSSVPVMVVRKKLRKHMKQKRNLNIRLANNLTNPSGVLLVNAKID